MCVCVCACVLVCEREKEKEREREGVCVHVTNSVLHECVSMCLSRHASVSLVCVHVSFIHKKLLVGFCFACLIAFLSFIIFAYI